MKKIFSNPKVIFGGNLKRLIPNHIKNHPIQQMVASGEPCFQGRPIRYFTNPYAFTLSHCRVMSQDPSSRSRFPPPWGGFDPGPPSSQFSEARTLPTELPGLGPIQQMSRKTLSGPKHIFVECLTGEQNKNRNAQNLHQKFLAKSLPNKK